MSTTTIIPVTDSNVIFICPTGSLLGVWTLGNDGSYRMDTKGNDCYMEYAFTATGISVKILGNWDHGVYSCQLDDGTPQWFTANSGTIVYNTGCAISGISNDKHTLRVTNAPMSGWWLTLENVTLTTGDAYTGTKTFTSGWASYQLPPTLANQTTASAVTAVTTVTASGSSAGNVSTAAFASVAAILGTLFVGATIAAIYFWVRDSRFRRDHQWTQAISAAPIAYTTEPAMSSNNTEYNPYTPTAQPSTTNAYPPSYPGTKLG